MKLHANCIAVQEHDGCFLVGFADHEFETQEYVLLQRTLDCDGNDQGLGLNRTYFEWSDQSRSAYGAIKRIELAPNRAIIQLNESASSKVGDGRFEITFQLDKGKFNELRSGLQVVLGTASDLLSIVS